MLNERTKRVLVYTASLLVAPLPLMPYDKGTRAFTLALVVCSTILMLSSYYVVHRELPLKHRPLFATKMLVAAFFTLVFAIALLVAALIHLAAR